MKCPQCGKENRHQASFCAWCGVKVPLAAAEPDRERVPAAQGSDPAELLAESAPDSARDKSKITLEGKVIPPAEAQTAPSEAIAASCEHLSLGNLLADRYEVTEILEAGDGLARYRARDLQRCAYCGCDSNDADDVFCTNCGASREEACYVQLVEQLRHPPERFDAQFVQDDRDYYVLFEPAASRTVTPANQDWGAAQLRWGYASDTGVTREHNEDYVDIHTYAQTHGTSLGLFIVADGLGGQDSGEVASQLAAQTVWSSLRQAVWEPTLRGDDLTTEYIRTALHEAIQRANQTVLEERAAQNSDMSTTITALLLVGNMAYIANVGDSRTYLWDAAGLQRVTRDHSLVQQLVEAGELSPDDIYTHPQRNLIFLSIGDQPQIKADVFEHKLAPDDRFLLCSDGLWEMLRDVGIEEVLMAETDPRRACDRMIVNANLAGGEDNISAIIVHVSPQPDRAVLRDQGGTDGR